VRRDRIQRACGWILAVLLAAGRSQAEDPAPKQPRAASPETARVAAPEPAKPTPGQDPIYVPPAIYVPPELGAPLGRLGGGGTRGTGRKATLQILAPDHLGLTLDEGPSLYWFLAEATDTRMDFVLRDGHSVEPLLELQLPTPTTAGIHALRLSDHGVKLASNENYQWFVSLVPDPQQRSKDFVVGAWIRRSDSTPALRSRLAAAPSAQAPLLYAESGVWYDSLASLSAQIDANPGDATLRARRAALLQQVGLSEVAAFDRADGKTP